MNNNLFTGNLTHLTAENPDTMGKACALWNRNSEYARLFDDEPIKLFSEKMRKDLHAGGQQQIVQHVMNILSGDPTLA